MAKPQGLIVATIPAVKAKAKFTSLIAKQLFYPDNETRVIKYSAVALKKATLFRNKNGGGHSEPSELREEIMFVQTDRIGDTR